MIECLETGIVYRNPKPHLRAIHAWHPSIARLSDGQLICAFDLGQAVESFDYGTYYARSLDHGRSWTAPQRLFEDDVSRPTTHTMRISRLRDDTLVGLGARFYRDDPEAGLTNRDNLGFAPMDVLSLRSFDGGLSWEGPRVIVPPIEGPCFEICHAVLELQDGRWLAPTSTWKGWNGDAPNGMKAVAFVSHDQGRTWPECIDVFDDYAEGTISFEQGMTQLPDGRIVAVTWRYHESTGKTLPTPYAVGPPDASRFSVPQLTGIHAQTAKIAALTDGRIICVYRRDDQPGLWMNLARLKEDHWVNLEQESLWQGASSGMTGRESGAEELGRLKFGFPSITVLPDGEVFVVFWCCEDDVHNIRWFRIRV